MLPEIILPIRNPKSAFRHPVTRSLPLAVL